MSAERLPFDELFLKEKLKSDPTTWETRRQLAHGLYDKQAYAEAAEIIWTTDQIPSTDLDLAFAIRILAKAQPRRAIRLLTAVLELNQGKAVQNMAMANALLHHGMVLQAARFYGAALEADPTLVNPDLEHFVLWSDDECTMWDLFEKNRPKLGELPWMLRDPKEALRLTSRISLHTTPIYVPELPKVHGEDLRHDLYEQEAKHQAKITPPPAVTIPIDRVDPKDRLYDETYGATVVNSSLADDVSVVSEETADEPIAPLAPVAAVEVSAPIAPAPVMTPVLPALEVKPVPSIPEAIPATPGLSTRVQLSARPTPLTSLQTVESAEPPETFPARVVFPDSSRPAASVAPVVPVIPAFIPAPIAAPIAAQAPAPSPFFADPTPPPQTPPPSVMPFFADSLPPIGGSAPKAVSFLGDERLTGPVQLPPRSPATPSPQLRTENHDPKPPEQQKEETRIPDALPISQSAVPTQLLHVKWSTAPARPGGAPATPPVAAPVPVLAPVPPGAPAPFAAAPPMPTSIPAATLMPTALPPYSQEQAGELGDAAAGIPTGPATRPLIPMGPPALGIAVPTGAPTRALLPSGTPPPNPTGAPTRVLLPSGTPPPTAGGLPTRRLLFTPPPPAQPPAESDGQ